MRNKKPNKQLPAIVLSVLGGLILLAVLFVSEGAIAGFVGLGSFLVVASFIWFLAVVD